MTKNRRDMMRNIRSLRGLESLETRRLLDGHGLGGVDTDTDTDPTAEQQLFGADLDDDGAVGFSDFLILAGNFGKEASRSHGDIDGDGRVGFSDFLMLGKDFGKSRGNPDPPGKPDDGPGRKPDVPRGPLDSSKFKQTHAEFTASLNLDKLSHESPFAGISPTAQVIYHPALQAGLSDADPSDSPANRIDPNTDSPYSGVGSIEVVNPTLGTFLCTGTAVSLTQVLTAGHCFDNDSDGVVDAGLEVRFFLNDGGDFSSTHSVTQIDVHPGFEGFATNPHDDLAFIQLAESLPESTRTYKISPHGIDNEQVLDLVGYGLSGNGETGFTVLPTFTAKRIGSNTAQLFVNDDDGETIDEIFVYDFDGPTAETSGLLKGGTLGNDLETTIGGGDSGGPAFVELNGENIVAGINTFNWEIVGITPEPGFFGSLAGGTILGTYIDWISTVAPDAILANEAPTFTAGEEVVSLEDAGPQLMSWAADVSAGEEEQAVSFEIVANSNPDLFAAPPAVDSGGVLNFTSKANVSGVTDVTLRLRDDGGTDFGGEDTSANHTLRISVLAVNDQPTFSIHNSVTVAQDAKKQSIQDFAGGFNPGPLEIDQAIAEYLTTNDNAELFSTQPSIDNSGRLTFTPAGNLVGGATVEVRVRDTGGTANGGVDLSQSQTFVIAIEPDANPPVDPGEFDFDLAGDVIVNEDAGNQRIADFVSNVGDSIIDFMVDNDNESLFRSNPTLGPNGQLRFTTAADAFGTAIVSVRAVGPDGDVFESREFDIAVQPVNDAPSVTLGGDVDVDTGGSYSMAGFATEFDAGNVFEVQQQVLEYVVTHDHPELFVVEPIIDAAGTLAFELAKDAAGAARVTVSVRDDGGTQNGGMDTSVAQLFSIRVNPDAPSVDPVVEALREQFNALVLDIDGPASVDLLISRMDRVIEAIDADFQPAMNLLRSLNNEINAFVNAKRLSEAEGVSLMEITNAMLEHFESQLV